MIILALFMNQYPKFNIHSLPQLKEVRPKHNLAYEGGDHTLLLLLKLASSYHDEANMLIYNILGEPPTPFKSIALNLEAVSGGHLF